MLNLTGDGKIVEDIDFAVDNYEGEGIYKFTNGEFVKLDMENRYKKYWKGENDIAERFGLSRTSVYKKYSKDIKSEIESGLLSLSEYEGTLYKISDEKINSKGEKIFIVDKFEDGEVTSLKLTEDDLPAEIQKENMIFSYGDNNEIITREDLQIDLVELVEEELECIKGIQDKKALDFRKEGQIYDVAEKDGYIMITNSKGRSIEDIEFFVDEYKGEGKYQVIDGVYKKLRNNKN